MHTKAYISNGKLKSNARGALDPIHTAEIEELLQSDLELGEALEDILIKIDDNQH